MVDKNFCMSSYLALRYVEKEGISFSDKIPYKKYKLNNKECIGVSSAEQIGKAIEKQLNNIVNSCKKTGLLLSGGMDSAILASYLPGTDAYTFRFLGGDFQKDELQRAEAFASQYDLKLHYVDIDWDIVKESLKPVMLSKGGPVHSIEPQLYHAAKQAMSDKVDVIIVGDASDYIFGGFDQLLSKDWDFDSFYNRYIYIHPKEVLKDPVSIKYLFELFRDGDKIDFLRFLDVVMAEESYGSYENAFFSAGIEYFDPYEILKMNEKLDLSRIRNGESKYLIRELFKLRYPDIPIPEKNPMPRPVDVFFEKWNGPQRPEFRDDIDLSKYTGNQRWLLWCLEEFLNFIDEYQG